MTKTSIFTEMLKMQGAVFNNAFDKLEDQDALRRPNEQVNHLNWLLGHLATCRFMLFNLIGGHESDPYFHMYFKTISTTNSYPLLSDIRDNWDRATRLLLSKIDSLPEDELDTEIPGKGGTAKDFISFFVYHEAYHLGQVGYARKFIGLPALKTN